LKGPRKGRREGKGNEPGRGRKRGNAKKMFFDGTNSRFYCKQMTCKSSMSKTNWFLSPNQLKTGPKRSQKPPFVEVCGPNKRRRSSLTRGLDELRIQPSLECGGLTPPSAGLLPLGQAQCLLPTPARWPSRQGRSKAASSRRTPRHFATGLFLGDITWRIIAGARSKRSGQSATARY